MSDQDDLDRRAKPPQDEIDMLDEDDAEQVLKERAAPAPLRRPQGRVNRYDTTLGDPADFQDMLPISEPHPAKYPLPEYLHMAVAELPGTGLSVCEAIYDIIVARGLYAFPTDDRAKWAERIRSSIGVHSVNARYYRNAEKLRDAIEEAVAVMRRTSTEVESVCSFCEKAFAKVKSLDFRDVIREYQTATLPEWKKKAAKKAGLDIAKIPDSTRDAALKLPKECGDLMSLHPTLQGDVVTGKAQLGKRVKIIEWYIRNRLRKPS